MFMNNFTKSDRSYWWSITNLTCCSSIKSLQKRGLGALMFIMFFVFSSSAFAQDYVDDCMHGVPGAADAESILTSTRDFSNCLGLAIIHDDASLADGSFMVRGEEFPEGYYIENPDGSISARTGFEKGSDHCDWKYYHVFTVKCDPTNPDIGSDGTAVVDTYVITYRGGDQEQPKLKKGVTFPTGEKDLKVCFDEAADRLASSPEYAYLQPGNIMNLFTDNCSHLKVDDMVQLRTKQKQSDCKWIIIYSYTIWDGCTDPLEYSVTFEGGDTVDPWFTSSLPAKEIWVDCDDALLYAKNAETLAWDDNCYDPGKKRANAEDKVDFSTFDFCNGGSFQRV